MAAMKKVSKKKKMGRPKINFDYDLLERLLRVPKQTQEDTASIMDCSVDTLSRRIRIKYDCTFAELWKKRTAPLRNNLQTKAYQMAMAGDRVMMIWCLKIMCGWYEEEPKNNGNIVINYDSVKTNE